MPPLPPDEGTGEGVASAIGDPPAAPELQVENADSSEEGGAAAAGPDTVDADEKKKSAEGAEGAAEPSGEAAPAATDVAAGLPPVHRGQAGREGPRGCDTSTNQSPKSSFHPASS